MIEKISGFPDHVLGFLCKGQVTRADYDNVLVPAVTRALASHDRVRLYYEIAPDVSGFDPGAMWEDMKTGVEHFTRWQRIAVVTDIAWISHTMRLFSFLIPGQTRTFSLAQTAQAREWILGE